MENVVEAMKMEESTNEGKNATSHDFTTTPLGYLINVV
jgi:hypothetical protein